jgi:uncharacterized membrane protein
VGGILFLFAGSVTAILSFLIKGELIEDPTDFWATHVQHVLPYFSTHGQLYASFYLLSHGIIKIILVVSLLRNKLWAYPATIVTLFLFITYQLYRLSYGFSLVLVLLTLFDTLIIYLIWHEYKMVKTHPRFSKKAYLFLAKQVQVFFIFLSFHVFFWYEQK